MLLLSGANATLRTRGGALPYHLAGLQVVRTMLLEMGGFEAIPAASDTIDMVAILRELTMPEVFSESSTGELDWTFSAIEPFLIDLRNEAYGLLIQFT